MNKLNTYTKSLTLRVMMVHVTVFQFETLCNVPRGLQSNGKATMKTGVRYSSATLLATYKTIQKEYRDANRCFRNLTLYAPCIILQYVYEPTRCTKFL